MEVSLIHKLYLLSVHLNYNRQIVNDLPQNVPEVLVKSYDLEFRHVSCDADVINNIG